MAKLNQQQAKHLSELLANEGKIKKKQLAEIAGVTPSAVSSWFRGVQMERERAERIHQEWPHYSVEWILGYSEYQNETIEQFSEIFFPKYKTSLLIRRALLVFAYASGYETLNCKDDTSIGAWERDLEAGGYKFSKGNKSVVLTDKQVTKLAHEVMGYVDLRIGQIIDRGEW